MVYFKGRVNHILNASSRGNFDKGKINLLVRQNLQLNGGF